MKNLIFVFAVILSASLASAEFKVNVDHLDQSLSVGSKGNGGDDCERDILKVRSDIKNWIIAGGSKDLSKKMPDDFDLERYDQLMLNSLNNTRVICTTKKLDFNGVPKTCRNSRNVKDLFKYFPNKLSRKQKKALIKENKPTIICNIKGHNSIPEKNKHKFYHHEDAGIAGLETNNGNAQSKYDISQYIPNYIEKEESYTMVVKTTLPPGTKSGSFFVQADTELVTQYKNLSHYWQSYLNDNLEIKKAYKKAINPLIFDISIYKCPAGNSCKQIKEDLNGEKISWNKKNYLPAGDYKILFPSLSVNNKLLSIQIKDNQNEVINLATLELDLTQGEFLTVEYAFENTKTYPSSATDEDFIALKAPRILAPENENYNGGYSAFSLEKAQRGEKMYAYCSSIVAQSNLASAASLKICTEALKDKYISLKDALSTSELTKTKFGLISLKPVIVKKFTSGCYNFEKKSFSPVIQNILKNNPELYVSQTNEFGEFYIHDGCQISKIDRVETFDNSLLLSASHKVSSGYFSSNINKALEDRFYFYEKRFIADLHTIAKKMELTKLVLPIANGNYRFEIRNGYYAEEAIKVEEISVSPGSNTRI